MPSPNACSPAILQRPRILSIVAARKGSKGLPSKCMLPIRGRAIIEHVIAWSRELRSTTEDIVTAVSTDIAEVQEMCARFGVDFIARPPELASDQARIEEVMLHAAKETGDSWDFLSLLFGNIPIRHRPLFFEPLAFLQQNLDFDAVLSFQSVEKFNPAWILPLTPDRLPASPERGYRRQDG